MLYKNIKPFIKFDKLNIPYSGIDNKNVCLFTISENSLFTDSYNYLNILSSSIRNVFIPKISLIKKENLINHYNLIKNYKLNPIMSEIGDYRRFSKHNFFLDFTLYLNYIQNKYKIGNYYTGNGKIIMNRVLDTLDSISDFEYEKVLLYTLNIEEYFSVNFKNRKIYPIVELIQNQINTQKLPFDKFILFVYTRTQKDNKNYYILLYDKNYKINLPKIKTSLNVLPLNILNNNEGEIEKTLDVISDSIKDKKVRSSVRNYINSNSDLQKISADDIDKEDLIIKSIVYSMVGNKNDTDNLSEKIKNNPNKEKVLNNLRKYILPKEKTKSYSTSKIVSMSKPEEMINYESPKHIIEKKKIDFKENLLKDLILTFKPLESESIPVTVKSYNVRTVTTPNYELKQTIKDRFTIDLIDIDKNLHTIEIDLPHLTENGTFKIYGQDWVIVNQLITNPIFFFKPFTGRFETPYNRIILVSKRLKNSNYLLASTMEYKISLIELMSLKLGFEESMKMFGVKYRFSLEKPYDDENYIKLPGGKFFIYKTENESGLQYVEGLKYCLTYLPKNINLNMSDKKFWEEVVINHTGTRNCIYQLDQLWRFIVTPAEREVLKIKNEPTEIHKIIKYIADEVVKGRVDDRNDITKQRLRSSELFTHNIQKYVIAAYNEFLSKKLSGDETAKIEINTSKIFTDAVTSQNLQLLESINPLEELSIMTRISPVGIGGIPDTQTFPQSGMNIHPSYYGNIDPLETPDGPNVGIQQHLSMGAAITNIRGLFAEKDKETINPTAILSCGPAMIPFVETNDAARILFGSGQTKQALPLKTPEIPCIQTGYESVLSSMLTDNFVKKSPINGKIVKITDNYISIEDKDKKITSIDIKPKLIRSGSGKNGISKFKVVRKLNDLVKKGDFIAEGANITNGMISNGINLLGAYATWKGYNYEDGIVLSESASKKMHSVHMDQKEAFIDPEEDVVFICKVGDEVLKGGILMTLTKAKYDIESYRHTRSESGGKILGIEVYSNMEKIPENLKESYENFKDYYININKKYPIGHFQERSAKIEGIKIIFIIEQEQKIASSDKENNRHGGKGVLVIEKDENMPTLPDGRKIELILNPLGVQNRMNFGQLYEINMGHLSWKLGRLMEEKKRNEFIRILEMVFKLIDFTEESLYTKNIIGYLKKISDSEYEKVREEIKQNIFFPLIIVPFKSPKEKDIEAAMKVVGLDTTYPLYLPEEKRNTDGKVTVGYIYFQRLEHIGEKKMASRSTGPYVSKTLAPTQGKRKDGGQKCGEYDVYSLLGWGCTDVVEEMLGPLSSDHASKNEMISEIIQTGKTSRKKSKSNPVKDMLNQYFLAIHLESE